MAHQDILYDKRDGIGTITINRPKVLNAFRAETVEEMLEAMRDAEDDRDIGVIVLAGAGDRAFCSGGDNSARAAGSEKEGGYGGRGLVGLPIEEFHSAIRDSRKPVIAKGQGYAIGGGNVLATACDLTIAAASARSASSRWRFITTPRRRRRAPPPSSKNAAPISVPNGGADAAAGMRRLPRR